LFNFTSYILYILITAVFKVLLKFFKISYDLCEKEINFYACILYMPYSSKKLKVHIVLLLINCMVNYITYIYLFGQRLYTMYELSCTL